MQEKKLLGMVYEGIEEDLKQYSTSIRGTNLLLMGVVALGFLLILSKLSSIEKELKRLNQKT